MEARMQELIRQLEHKASRLRSLHSVGFDKMLVEVAWLESQSKKILDLAGRRPPKEAYDPEA
jgi:hypothetical protein